MRDGTGLPSILFSLRTGEARTGDLRAAVAPAYLRLYDGLAGHWLAAGRHPVEILRPEIYPATTDRRALFGCERPLHVILKPPEEIRVLKGATNVGCVVLERPALRCEVSDNRPFSDERRMLGLLDEIWVGSEAAVGILAEAGLTRVRMIPAPLPPEPQVPLRGAVPTAEIAWFAGGKSTAPGFGAWLPERGAGRHTVFAAGLDDLDRSDAATLVDAFLALAAEPPTTLLLFSGTQTGFDGLKSFVVGRQLAAARVGPHQAGLIGLVPPGIGERERAVLRAAVAFYACVSRFEGDNRPMLEAMACGCIPVTVRHSAICEAVAADHPLLIATAPVAGGLPRATSAACTEALAAAVALPPAARATLAARARDTARARLSAAPLLARLRALADGRNG